ncbi:uncharacterized protein RMCC_2770 [Mycolicibacterium canariasense]|uniref:Alkaline shock response membrane anchor protein AmaP n=1 Tax=Mycolicibacterium canariasense TaxID=228230 RepID=A0A100WC64_MYCCR|nr:DUF6286 domain-containing protein [Mycolicibacterium canariasense]MCV7210367.1 hypothetical protein [Mycolicibacterium canariasense]ORU97131.1 hypothetical protein AWB94_30805 [Mycolicibacterium canariasense]GAS95804.1 uncharacterized protein RMCC_2770 [Mycolicibacterium canariasense]
MTTADAVPLPAPGRVPVATATARYIGVVLALVVLAAGVLAVREAGVTLGWITGTSWIGAAVTAVDGLHSQWWMVPAGAVALAAGAWLVFSALRPRRKTAIAVDASAAVWMRPRDVARLASHAASAVPGVEVLRADATRRKVTLYVGLTGVESGDASGSQPGTVSGAAAKGAVTAAVGSATEILLPPPRIAVRIGTSRSV